MTTNGSFIGYSVNSKGFRFYYPSYNPKVVDYIIYRGC